jgi:hypothetical protein
MSKHSHIYADAEFVPGKKAHQIRTTWRLKPQQDIIWAFSVTHAFGLINSIHDIRNCGRMHSGCLRGIDRLNSVNTYIIPESGLTPCAPLHIMSTFKTSGPIEHLYNACVGQSSACLLPSEGSSIMWSVQPPQKTVAVTVCAPLPPLPDPNQ